ncbi:MAG: NAD-dependent protein deacylase [Firmicutes bacterium]|nr:NAD-dependent protein deacylase [Bacillota bacterium]
MPEREQWKKLQEMIAASQRIVFFGGAGVSTESGIPDFRGEKGLYKAKTVYGHSPEAMVSHSFFVNHPQEFYRYYLNEMIYEQAQPNAAHRALARLEKQGKLQAVITQNIDGLHQLAGSRNVLELHGSVHRNYCLNCGAKYGLDFMLQHRQGSLPCCLDCGGLVRPDVVLYEEGLDGHVLSEAERYIRQADCLIIGGTSLAVYPAAGLVRYFQGDRLALINKSVTDFDRHADLLVRDNIGEALDWAVPQ